MLFSTVNIVMILEDSSFFFFCHIVLCFSLLVHKKFHSSFSQLSFLATFSPNGNKTVTELSPSVKICHHFFTTSLRLFPRVFFSGGFSLHSAKLYMPRLILAGFSNSIAVEKIEAFFSFRPSRPVHFSQYPHNPHFPPLAQNVFPRFLASSFCHNTCLYLYLSNTFTFHFSH